jgi:hypothetical protein
METHNAASLPDHDQEVPENSSHIDPSIRVLVAIACFAQMFLFEEVQEWQSFVVGFGIYLIMTVIIRQDPINTLLNKSRAFLA